MSIQYAAHSRDRARPFVRLLLSVLGDGVGAMCHGMWGALFVRSSWDPAFRPPAQRFRFTWD